jgi:hypothetical protein
MTWCFLAKLGGWLQYRAVAYRRVPGKLELTEDRHSTTPRIRTMSPVTEPNKMARASGDGPAVTMPRARVSRMTNARIIPKVGTLWVSDVAGRRLSHTTANLMSVVQRRNQAALVLTNVVDECPGATCLSESFDMRDGCTLSTCTGCSFRTLLVQPNSRHVAQDPTTVACYDAPSCRCEMSVRQKALPDVERASCNGWDRLPSRGLPDVWCRLADKGSMFRGP